MYRLFPSITTRSTVASVAAPPATNTAGIDSRLRSGIGVRVGVGVGVGSVVGSSVAALETTCATRPCG